MLYILAIFVIIEYEQLTRVYDHRYITLKSLGVNANFRCLFLGHMGT